MNRTERKHRQKGKGLRSTPKGRLAYNASPPVPSPLLVDPSRTGDLRRRLEADLSRRWNRLRLDLVNLVVVQDSFGLGEVSPSVSGQYGHLSGPDRVKTLSRWLEHQIEQTLFPTDWWTEYVLEAYLKGAGRSFEDVRRGQLPEGEKLPRREEFLTLLLFRGNGGGGVTVDPLSNAARIAPQYKGAGGRFITERVHLLALRLETELRGVTAQTAQRVARELAVGIDQKRTPRQVGTAIAEATDLGKERSLVIARTEIIRDHAEAQLDAMEMLGVEDVTAAVEWTTAGDGRVCPLCAPLKGVVLKPHEARGMIPRHPRCRCCWTPALIRDPEQKRDRRRIEASFRKSVKAERKPDPDNPWTGEELELDRSRPRTLNLDPSLPDATLVDRLLLNARAKLSGGRWITTKDGHRVYLKGGKAIAGNPHVLKKMKEEGKGGGGKGGSGVKDRKEKVTRKRNQDGDQKPAVKGSGKDKGPDRGPSKSFKGEDDAHSWGRENYGKWVDKLSKDEHKALGRYVNHEFREINGGLREGGGKVPGHLKERVEHMDKAIEKAGPTKEAVTVHRGLGADVVDQMKPGGEFKDHGFVSTSLNPGVGEHYGQATMEVHVPKGSKGTYATAIMKSDKPGTEQEFLLPRGSKFKIISVTEKDGRKHVVAEVVNE